MFCINCGKEVGEATKFCGNCGNPVMGVSNQQSENVDNNIIWHYGDVCMADSMGFNFVATSDIGQLIGTNKHIIFLPEFGRSKLYGYTDEVPSAIDELTVPWSEITKVELKHFLFTQYHIQLNFNYQLKNGKAREKIFVYVTTGEALNDNPISHTSFTKELYQNIFDIWSKNK